MPLRRQTSRSPTEEAPNSPIAPIALQMAVCHQSPQLPQSPFKWQSTINRLTLALTSLCRVFPKKWTRFTAVRDICWKKPGKLRLFGENRAICHQSPDPCAYLTVQSYSQKVDENYCCARYLLEKARKTPIIWRKQGNLPKKPRTAVNLVHFLLNHVQTFD